MTTLDIPNPLGATANHWWNVPESLLRNDMETRAITGQNDVHTVSQ